MKISLLQVLFVTTLTAAPGLAMADHALLMDGRVLYNVMVPDGASTGGLLVRIRTTRQSFEYDPRTNVVTSLPRHSVIKRVADYVETTKTVGREEATALVTKKDWTNYLPPPRPVLVAPTPAPKATPIPYTAVAQATPVPLNVVPESVPLEERLDQQLDMFMKEQTKLSQDAATSLVQSIISPQEVTAEKVRLLEQQKMILDRYFPQNDEQVRLAVNYWNQQLERARQTGRFDLENL